MNKKKLIGAGMVAAAFLVSLALLWPYYDAIQKTKDILETKKAELDQKKAFVQKMTDLRKQIEARKEDLIKMEPFLSSGRHTEDVVVSLETISQEAGVAIGEFKTGISKGKGGESFETLQVEFTASGPYSALFHMVKLMERNLRIFDVQEINLAEKEGASASGLLVATIKLNTYFIKNK